MKPNQLHHPRNSLAFEVNTKSRTKRRSGPLLREEIPVSVSVLFFYLSLSSSDHAQLQGRRGTVDRKQAVSWRG